MYGLCVSRHPFTNPASNTLNLRFRVSKSSFGWTPSEKRTELFHPDSRFILMRARESVALDAFAMFRFDTEENVDEVKEEVLYL
jgi:hypothetical protein